MSQMNFSIELDNPAHVQAAIAFLQSINSNGGELPKAESPIQDEKPKRRRRTKAEIEADKKPAEEKPAEEKPAEEKPAEEKPAEEKPAEEITVVSLRRLAGDKVTQNDDNRQKVKAILTELGAPNFTKLEESKYGECKSKLEAL